MKKIFLVLLTITTIFAQKQETVSLEDIYISVIDSMQIKIPEEGKDFSKEEKELIKINTLNYLISVYNDYYNETKSYEKAFINLLSYLGYESNMKIKQLKKNEYEIALYIDKEVEYKYAVYLFEIISLIMTNKYGANSKGTIVMYKDIQLKNIKR